MKNLRPSDCLPADAADATLVGRIWREGPMAGPCVVAIRGSGVFDITATAPTLSDLLDNPDAVDIAASAPAARVAEVEELLALGLHASPEARHTHLLAPCDLQAIKACGVTFAVSLIERVIEEQAHGDPLRADTLRRELQSSMGQAIERVKPGSAEAERLKQALSARGAWSPYLEVGLGPDAEVFTKAQPMSAVGFGADVGIGPGSAWNNPEPEVVLAVNSQRQIVGATLGNDVNLRDVEGRSALLLGQAKDNNASCAIGPFIRLFDARFNLDAVRRMEVKLTIHGTDDGFHAEGINRMQAISRDPLELVAQVAGAHHQYPDGFMLFLGTMFTPTDDRGPRGSGFTHHMGDEVAIASPSLGTLFNRVQPCTDLPPWTFGARALFANLLARGVLKAD